MNTPSSPGVDSFPPIPTAEVQISTFKVTTSAGGAEVWDYCIMGSTSSKLVCQKTAAGMHLVLRYIQRDGPRDKPVAPPIRVTFPGPPEPGEVFAASPCNCHPIASGINLQPGEWVTLEVKRHVGIGAADGKSVPFHVQIPYGEGYPGTDGPEIILVC